jgi:hypothetical protein
MTRLRGITSAATVLLVVGATTAQAQATGTPSYNAPYRAFASNEFGGTFSLLNFDDIGLEGQFRFGVDKFDIGLRGGIVDAEGPDNTRFILGGEGRFRVVEHSENFPLDGALVAGLGTWEFDNLFIPVGISLGRRVTIDNFSFIAYTQPTLFFYDQEGPQDDNLGFSWGFGADFKVGNAVDLRTSLGFALSDLEISEGLAVSLVWVH